MKFDKLNATIPYAKGGKAKSLSMSPYENITLLMPGRHADESKGGDFCVCVTDESLDWDKHQFKHDDIFLDISHRGLSSGLRVTDFMRFYLDVIRGADPDKNPFPTAGIGGVIDNLTFFRAVQCLAVAEHRRYAQHEAKFGGRYLPFRFAAGIAEAKWDPITAINVQRYGRPAVERLEKQYGIPELTKELMNG